MFYTEMINELAELYRDKLTKEEVEYIADIVTESILDEGLNLNVEVKDYCVYVTPELTDYDTLGSYSFGKRVMIYEE